MKKYLVLSLLAFLSFNSMAQERLNFLDYVSDMFDNNLTLSQFKEKYGEYFSEEYNKSTSSVFLENLDFFGYDAGSLTMIMPEHHNAKMVSIIPAYQTLDSISRYQSAAKCHKGIIARFGEPVKKEPISFDDPISKGMAENLHTKGGTKYLWEPFGRVLMFAQVMKTDKEDRYMVTFMTMDNPFATSVPLQRKFFHELELGKSVVRQQIAAALGTTSYNVREERTSSCSKRYNYSYNFYFGGIEWSYLKLQSIENLLECITFTHTHAKSNKDVYDSLLETLTVKYGEPEINGNQASWIDGKTIAMLKYFYGKSKGGEMRHYVMLLYQDIELFDKSQNLIISEL